PAGRSLVLASFGVELRGPALVLALGHRAPPSTSAATAAAASSLIAPSRSRTRSGRRHASRRRGAPPWRRRRRSARTRGTASVAASGPRAEGEDGGAESPASPPATCCWQPSPCHVRSGGRRRTKGCREESRSRG